MLSVGPVILRDPARRALRRELLPALAKKASFVRQIMLHLMQINAGVHPQSVDKKASCNWLASYSQQLDGLHHTCS